MVFTLVHIIHVLTVILWIGGLAFVTTMVFPLIFRTPDALQKVLLFQRIEHKFAKAARIYNLIVGISGFIMVAMAGWHKIMFTKAGAPLTIMTGIWVFWFIMLFGLEPLVIKKMLDNMARGGDKMDIDGIFAKLNRMHWVMMGISLIAAASGIVFAHGYL